MAIQEATPTADEKRWKALRQQVAEEQACRAFEVFRAAGIEPVLIKGLAAALNYPNPADRVFGDIDLAFRPEDFEAASALRQAAGSAGFSVDCHESVRHLDSLPWDDLFANSRILELHGCRVRVLRPEDHLRVLCVHWLNDGGIHRERLWDMYRAVSRRPPDFDWDRCLGTVDPVRRGWVSKAVGAAVRYLGLESSELPFSAEELELPSWMLATLEREWASGVRLIPLQVCIRSPREFVRQIRKRFPPNPIQATIELGGPLDDGGRLAYQLRDIVKRIAPSAEKFIKVYFSK